MDVKQCSNCNECKPLSEFYNCAQCKDKKMRICKACHDERSRAYQEENRAALAIKHHAYYLKNRDRYIANARAWQAEHCGPPYRMSDYYVDVDIKECTLCHEEKHISEFTKHRNTIDGLNYYCRVCNASEARWYYQRNIKACRERSHERYLRRKIEASIVHS